MSKQSPHFSPKTFSYFESAKQNKKKVDWFEKNKKPFEDHVKKPFEELTRLLNQNFGSELPGIDFLPRKISRPVRRNLDEDGGLVRTNAMAYFSEKATSQFESNPGIYISVGATPNDNVMGVGLYMVSSRQMSLLRNAIVEDFEEIDTILSSKKLKKRWGDLSGDVYKRFPKGFDENSEPAKYLRHKQFFLGQELSKKQICDKKFFENIVRDVELSLSFLQWVRRKVGVYKRS